MSELQCWRREIAFGGPTPAVEMNKGGLCRLELETVKAGRCAMLEWSLTPRHFGPKRAAKTR